MKSDPVDPRKMLRSPLRNPTTPLRGRYLSAVAACAQMVRPQSGTFPLIGPGFVGSALQSVGAALEGHAVRIAPPIGLPLVRLDTVLINRVLVNLLENTHKAHRGSRLPLALPLGEPPSMPLSEEDEDAKLPSAP